MTNFLLKLATKSNGNYTNEEARLRVGYMGSIVNLIVNVILSLIKLTIGFMISSIGVIADGFNNVADSSSAIISLVGFKLSSKPPDKNHPHGHGRVEYIAALIVAFMVILVGFQFIKSSFNKILNPSTVKFELISFIILVTSIGVKVWLSIFSKKVGEKINSKSLKATGVDAMGDVLTTSVVVISIFLGQFTKLPLDGIIGLVVSLIIIYSGYSLVKETISPLIGEAPSKELIDGINRDVMSYDYITGVHDLVIHTYGEGRTMAVIDAEFPANVGILEIHEVRTQAEREIGEKYNLTLLIHMDPLGQESKERYELRNEIKHIVKENPAYLSMHDFNVWEEGGNEIAEFHIVVDGNKIEKDQTMETIKEEVEDVLSRKCDKIICNVIVDIEY